jgi:DNA-binding NarL/FixJ family response regulator
VAALPSDASLAALEHAVGDEGGLALHSPRTTAVLLERLRLQAQHEFERARLMLTTREWDVARLIGDGLTNKEIAARLSIELPTVKSHVHSVLKKLGARRRFEVGLRVRAVPTPPASDGAGAGLRRI